jgi:hypothetical protein
VLIERVKDNKEVEAMLLLVHEYSRTPEMKFEVLFTYG